ncbi:hypothetical protein QVN60_05660, partial [Yersinia aleksiciae]|uniref:hypothetical protein n=1 Tax=Yersinia aleksiciae TaxID=263819 RepID=UPI0025AA79B5
MHCEEKLVIYAAVAKTTCKTLKQQEIIVSSRGNGSLVQLVEQLTFNQLVKGSSRAKRDSNAQ